MRLWTRPRSVDLSRIMTITHVWHLKHGIVNMRLVKQPKCRINPNWFRTSALVVLIAILIGDRW